MPSITKAQAKRLLKSIDSKNRRLWAAAPGSHSYLTTADMIVIEKIVARSLKRLG